MQTPKSSVVPLDRLPAPLPGQSTEHLRLIDLHEVMNLTGMGRTSINEKVRDPQSGFPKPVRCMRHNRFVLGEVLGYIANLIERRDAELGGAK